MAHALPTIALCPPLAALLCAIIKVYSYQNNPNTVFWQVPYKLEYKLSQSVHSRELAIAGLELE
jgi:hypothetical protein